MMTSSDKTSLVLLGGGARAAYQAGAIKAIIQILNEEHAGTVKNPFDIISGSSAGAINAAAYACLADDVNVAVKNMLDAWLNLKSEDVYRTDPVGVLGNGFKWMSLLLFGWLSQYLRKRVPRSLLDNRPLEGTLNKVVQFDRLNEVFAKKALKSLAITATSYTSGNHYTFFQSAEPLEGWERTRRVGFRHLLQIEHLMASGAIPFLFPAKLLETDCFNEWFGDGSMRLLTPLSPAVHLGADKVLVISTTQSKGYNKEGCTADLDAYPSLAQLGEQAISDIFIDGLTLDIERAERVNEILQQIGAMDAVDKEDLTTDKKQQFLRPLKILTLRPSQAIDEIAIKHLKSMPKTVRAFLKVLGVSSKIGEESGGIVASYLLFENAFTKELIALGEQDTLKRKEEILDFFAE